VCSLRLRRVYIVCDVPTVVRMSEIVKKKKSFQFLFIRDSYALCFMAWLQCDAHFLIVCLECM
jgi:hypothetical protein